MPFDNTTIRQPTVTMLPPTPREPPERGGRPLRIRVEIEILDRRAQTPHRHGYRFGTFTLTLLILAMLAALAGCTRAMSQPSNWSSYREGFVTRYQGNDRDGGQWSGTSYKQGFTTYFDATGPNGQSQHCRSWQQGWQTFTECD